MPHLHAFHSKQQGGVQVIANAVQFAPFQIEPSPSLSPLPVQVIAQLVQQLPLSIEPNDNF
jgi:hypothetical protein